MHQAKPPLGKTEKREANSTYSKKKEILPINHELAKKKLQVIMDRQSNSSEGATSERQKSLYQILSESSGTRYEFLQLKLILV